MRAEAWSLCIEPPHTLGFVTAFTRVVCGDALGNVTPLGPLVGEPTKIAFVRGQTPVAPALTALAIENVVYALSVAAMIAAGAIALLFSVPLSVQLREFSEFALGAVIATFVVAAWVLWRRPAVISALLPASRVGASRLEKLRAVEEEVLTFASRRRQRMPALVVLELGFHALGVFEKHITLWMILGTPPPLLDLLHPRNGGSADHRRIQVRPVSGWCGRGGNGVRHGFARAGRTPGVTMSIVRKARMGIWSLIGTAMLVHRGLDENR